jgi:hypothetical protein
MHYAPNSRRHPGRGAGSDLMTAVEGSGATSLACLPLSAIDCQVEGGPRLILKLIYREECRMQRERSEFEVDEDDEDEDEDAGAARVGEADDTEDDDEP